MRRSRRPLGGRTAPGGFETLVSPLRALPIAGFCNKIDPKRPKLRVGAPFLSVYPGLDFEMLPLALIVVILGGTGSLLGALVGSFLIGFLYNFGQALFPDLAYVILFLPMLLPAGREVWDERRGLRCGSTPAVGRRSVAPRLLYS